MKFLDKFPQEFVDGMIVAGYGMCIMLTLLKYLKPGMTIKQLG